MRLAKSGIFVICLAFTLQCLPAFAGAQPGQKIGMRNGLPPCTTDSFVHEAAGEAEHIYGDEGTTSIPPYFGFNTVHRINNGIFNIRDKGLTTGHGSYLPDAWGADEFLAPPGEWSQSGANGGNRQTNGVDNGGGGGSNGGNGAPAPVKPPYQIGPDWIAVNNTHNGQIMGWMAPGETFQQFFSGQSGHLLAGYEAEGQYILQNQLGDMTSPYQMF